MVLSEWKDNNSNTYEGQVKHSRAMFKERSMLVQQND